VPTRPKKRKPPREVPRSGLRPVATAADLLALARRHFLAGDRLSIDELAVELGISRATAFRWAGNVDLLTGQVIAGIVDDTHRRSLREAKGTGADRIIDATARGLRYIAASEPYQAFIRRDPERALRIVASKEAPVQARTIALNQQLLEEEIASGALSLPVDAHTMAYALVRIGESFLYADMIAGEKPDLDKAIAIVELMLR
jgi:Tetracyclin repressor-like, C-terminal domain